jgi:O-antigen/teichoic acid export membrane protein
MTPREFLTLRIATAAGVAGVGLLGGWLLPPAEYGIAGAYCMIAKSALLLGLGASTGFISMWFYPGTAYLDPEGFRRCYLAHLSVAGALAVVFAVMFDQRAVLGAIGFCCLIPWMVLEPFARVSRRFWVSQIPDIILTIACVTYLGVAIADPSHALGRHDLVLPVSTAAATVIALASMRGKLRARERSGRLAGLPAPTYWRIVSHGFPVAVGTLIYSAALLASVLLVQARTSQEELGVYSLALQAATGAALMQSSLNFAGAIDIGEALGTDCPLLPFLMPRIRRSAIIALIGSAIAASGAWIAEEFVLSEYRGLWRNAAVLSAGLTAFQVAGACSPILVFARSQGPTVGTFTVGLLLWLPAAWYLSAGEDGGFRVTVSLGALLCAQAACVLVHTTIVVRRLDRDRITELRQVGGNRAEQTVPLQGDGVA